MWLCALNGDLTDVHRLEWSGNSGPRPGFSFHGCLFFDSLGAAGRSQMGRCDLPVGLVGPGDGIAVDLEDTERRFLFLYTDARLAGHPFWLWSFCALHSARQLKRLLPREPIFEPSLGQPPVELHGLT